MQEVTSLHRKSLTRLMHTASLERTKRQKPRPRTYGPEVERVVVRVWESRDYICAEQLTPGHSEQARHLARFEPLGLTAQVEGRLATISRATVARILSKYRSRMRRLPQKGAERANQVTKGVPMGRIPWDISDPGHFEVDLVHHNGESSAGLYGHTIQLVDVATGWSERVAVMGRGQSAMEAGFRRIVERVPFAIRELHPDNASRVLQSAPGALLEGQSRGGAALAQPSVFRRTIIASWSKRTTRWCASMWGTCAWTAQRRWRHSMPSTSRCGSITISFNRCCISARKPW